MKAFLKKIRKRSLHKTSPASTDAHASKPRPRLATSTSTMMTSATNSMASIPAGSATATTQVIQTTDVTVSLRLGPSHRSCWYNYSIIVIDQTAQLEIPASVSTPVTDGIASVAHLEENDTSVSCLQLCFLVFFLLMISRLGTLNSFLLALWWQAFQLFKQLVLLWVQLNPSSEA